MGLKKHLDGAPELVFVKEINDVSYYQCSFRVMMPNPFIPADDYQITVAEDSERFYVNIRDQRGLDYSVESPKEDFLGQWKQMLTKLRLAPPH